MDQVVATGSLFNFSVQRKAQRESVVCQPQEEGRDMHFIFSPSSR